MFENVLLELIDYVIVYYLIIIIYLELMFLCLESWCVNIYWKYKLIFIYC